MPISQPSTAISTGTVPSISCERRPAFPNGSWVSSRNLRPAPPKRLRRPAMAAEAEAAESVSSMGALRQQFLVGMSHAACTVNVVTTDGVAGRHGVTVSAMVSVSADTPQPTLLVCIHHLSPAVAALLENEVFCVNVLRDDQAHISDNFAGRGGVQGAAKFECASWTTQVTGAPRVVDCLVAFD